MNLGRASLFAICLLCVASVASAGPITDPANDVYPFGGPAGAGSPDIIKYSGDVNGFGAVTFSVTFGGAISPPSAFAANSIFGYLDLDTDKKAATGGNAPWGSNQPGGNSWINFAVANGFLDGPPIALGDEYFVDLSSEFGGIVSIFRTSDNTVVGTVPIFFGPNDFSLTIPLSLLGNPSPAEFHYGVYVGNVFDFSGDRAPNGAEPAVVVPEPTSLAVCGLITLGAAGYCWPRRKQVSA